MKTITIALLCASLLAGQSLTTVSDTIYLPVGADKFVGRVQIDAPSLTYGGVTYTRQTKTYTVTDGTLSVTLVPNDAATPSGTSYTVRYYAAGRQPWSEIWVVPTSVSTLKVSDVRTATVPSPSMSVSPSQLVVTPYAILYGSAAGAGLNLAPNTSTTPKYLRQVGDGTTAGAPTWAEAESTACPTCVTTDGSYSNPTWLTALDWSKLLFVPSTFTPSAHTHAYSSLSDVPSTFAPSAHASSHGPSAADPVTLAQSQVTGLIDALAGKQATITGAPSTWPSFGGAALLNVGAVTGTVAAGDDSRFTNARTPTAHANSHLGTGSDPLTLAQSQVTNLTSDLAAKLAAASNLSDLTSASTARTNLGLGSAATASAGDFAPASHSHAASAITSGAVGLARGGTGSDLSSSGGTNYIVKQSSAGGVLTSGALTATEIAAAGTLSNSTTGNAATATSATTATTASGLAAAYTDWSASSGGASILNKPTLGNAAAKDVGTTTGTVAAGDDPRLSNARTPVAHAASHGVGQPDAATLAQSQVTGLETALAGKVAGAASLTTSSAIPKVLSSGTLGEGILRDSGTSVSAIATAGSEVFAESSFDTTTKWTLDGDFAAGTGKLTFTFSAGYATALQASTDFSTALETPGTYTFAYTVANSTATGATVGLCDFAQTWCSWGDATDGAHAVSVLIPSGVTGLYIVVSAESGGLDLPDVSLKAVGGRLYGKSLAATRLAVIDSAGDAGDTMAQFLYTVNPSGNTTASYYGGYLNLEVPSTNSRNIGSLTGFTNSVIHGGTGTVDSVDGLVSSVNLRGPTTNAKNVWASTFVTGSTTGVYSLESSLDVVATGSVDASLGWGSAAYLRVSGGAAESRTATLTNPKGLRILHEYGESGGLGTVTVTGPIGIGTELYLESGGSLDSFSHISIGAPTINGTGAISGTLYGVYVGAQTGATTANYNIFSAGASTKNRFEGEVNAGSFKIDGSSLASSHLNDYTTVRTYQKEVDFPDPVVADSGKLILNPSVAIHITRLFCSITGSTNVVVNLDKRAESSIGTDSGSHLLGSDLTVTSSGANTSTFSSSPCGGTSSCAVAAHTPIVLTVTSVSGTPNKLACSLDYTKD